jgi:hypothetical protein
MHVSQLFRFGQAIKRVMGRKENKLVSDSIERTVVVETEVSGMKNVVGICLFRKLVQGTEMTCIRG